MNNIEQIRELTSSIKGAVDVVQGLERTRSMWTEPEGLCIAFGVHQFWVVRKDGTVNPPLIDVQKAMLKSIDVEIIKAKSRVEGLAHKLSKLVKSGVSA